MNQPVVNSIEQLIGNTPLIRLEKLTPANGASILAKCEFLNPGGSVKDRIALSMINQAEKDGRLQPGMTVVEATSGNTGIGLAMLCAERGYRLILTMPETMSFERRSLVARYGAEVVLTPGAEGMLGATQRADDIANQSPRCLQLLQFSNAANPDAHYRTTGPEILRDTEGRVDAFVAAVGTGGTLTGVGRALREALPKVRIIAAEPAASPVLSGGDPGPHSIEGIGAGFVPDVLDCSLIDEVITVDDRTAFRYSQALAQQEALMVGISAGANVYAAVEVAKRLEPHQNVVTILCDNGMRYFSVEEYFRQEDTSDLLR